MKYRIVLFASALALVACKDTNAPSIARVRFVHASSGTSNFDVLAGTTVLATNIAFGASSCVAVATGTPTINLRQSGTATTLLTASPTLVTGTNYLVVVSGGTAAGALRATTFAENASAAGSGRARLQVVHAANGLGGQDVFITAPGAIFGAPSFTNLAYGASTGYLDVPSGSQQVRATNTGSTVTLNATSATLTLTSTGAKTVILTAGGAPYQFLIAGSCG